MICYNNPSQLGVNNDTASLETIIGAMADGSVIRFWTNPTNSYPVVNSQILAGVKHTYNANITNVYGNVTIEKNTQTSTVTFEEYDNTSCVIVARYSTVNNHGWSGWNAIMTNDGNNTIILNSSYVVLICRKYGKIKFLTTSCYTQTAMSAGGTYTIGTLDVDYRPIGGEMHQLLYIGNTKKVFLNITNSGVLTIDPKDDMAVNTSFNLNIAYI